MLGQAPYRTAGWDVDCETLRYIARGAMRLFADQVHHERGCLCRHPGESFDLEKQLMEASRFDWGLRWLIQKAHDRLKLRQIDDRVIAC